MIYNEAAKDERIRALKELNNSTLKCWDMCVAQRDRLQFTIDALTADIKIMGEALSELWNRFNIQGTSGGLLALNLCKDALQAYEKYKQEKADD